MPDNLTNFQKWQHFMSGFNSPQQYVDFGYYYLISAALQRRVWYGPDHSPLFPNQYIILVGPPGIGKGLVLKQVATILKYHKLRKANRQKEIDKHEGVDRDLIEAIAKADDETAKKEANRGSVNKTEEPLLIPVAADASTYEALVTAMAKALRRKDYKYFDEALGKDSLGIYTHSSLCFCLEELSSLLRKHADDAVQFLMVAFDCGDYKKDTKTQGVDFIQRCCLNLLAGTTPSFMQRTFTDGLLNEGFSSRSLFIYAAKNRRNNINIPDLTLEQKECHNDIIKHVEKLTHLYGRVTTDPDTEAFLQNWWDGQQEKRLNANEKLVHYYARKQVHMRKLAMAIHFGESTDMHMGIEPHIKAIEALEKQEPVMHHALVYGTANPLYRVGLKICDFIEGVNGASLKEVLVKFWEELPKSSEKELQGLLDSHVLMGKLYTEIVKRGNKQVTVYKVTKEMS